MVEVGALRPGRTTIRDGRPAPSPAAAAGGSKAAPTSETAHLFAGIERSFDAIFASVADTKQRIQQRCAKEDS
jgi:hypothetical protein